MRNPFGIEFGMDRIFAKGPPSTEKVRNLTVYRSAIIRAQAQRGELLYAVKHDCNGALTPMVQFLLESGDLSADQHSDLESLIKARKKGA